MLYVSSTCPPTAGTCIGASNIAASDTSSGNTESVEASIDGAATVFVYVDGATGSAGAYHVTVDRIEGPCEGGDDEDGDGKIDCADSDCSSDAACR